MDVEPKKSFCVCGQEKDKRSIRCAKCSGKSISKNITSDELHLEQKQKVVDNIAVCRSFLELSKVVGIRRETVSKIVNQYDFDISHFRACADRPPTYDETFIITDHRRNSAIKGFILKNDLLKYECTICGQQPVWNNKPLMLHLDHINGVSGDNTFENLRFLCPNCHEQTDTCRGKNCKGTRKKKEK